MPAETLPSAPDAPIDAFVEILGPVAEPFPLPVERAMILRATLKVATAQAEMMRYLVDGAFGPQFAFQEEVAGMLVEGLRLVLEVEGARFAAMQDTHDLCSAGERETLSQMLGSITRFQEEWGRG